MLLKELFEEITPQQLADVEIYADRLWNKLGIDVEFTRHFVERMNAERNGKPISAAELVRLFKREAERYGKDVKGLDDRDEAVFIDLSTDVNLPFVIKDTDGDGKKELFAKTIMRKKDFKSHDPLYKVR